jgi:hypothetical protein
MNLQDLSKDALVEVARIALGRVGDSARTPKPEYIRMLETHHDPEAIAQAVATVTANGVPMRAFARPTNTDPAGTLEQLRGALSALGIGAQLDEEAVAAIVNSRVEALRAEFADTHGPRRIEVAIADRSAVDIGIQHHLFPVLLQALTAGCNVWLSGPAGSGKTTAAQACAKALNLPFYFNGAIDSEYKLLGFIDAQGRIVSTQFRQAFEHGGLYLFDECDASMPGATLAFQAALANGFADFPGGAIQRHPDCHFIAAANTWGNGATYDYVGRNKMDAAFLDRFVRMGWDYDENLERAIAANDNWVSMVQTARARARAHGLKVVISPRASINGARLLAAGMSIGMAAELTYLAGLTPEQRSHLEGN